MPSSRILESVSSPADLAPLSLEQLKALCSEIRDEIVDTVASNGGHLAPSLGVVELTVALHKVFDAPRDKIVWDVGHQSYAHKILTGRLGRFKTLRRYGGVSGFTSRAESEYDPFGAGHAGTAISAALGMAAARDRKGGDEKVVAVIGDGSLVCGVSLEALNNVRSTTNDFIIVVNDNKMSISRSVGAIPNYLNSIITGRSYNHFKAFAKMAVKRIPGGEGIVGGIQRIEEATKSLFVPGVFFEELGLRYIGPIHGHNLHELMETFEKVKEFNRPVIVHVITEKGCGCEYAKEAPEKFHGVSNCIDPDTGDAIEPALKKGGFSSAFGSAMLELAEKRKDLVALTAAMRMGTGLLEFSAKHPDRFFDVGIAEEHGVVFAAGLAAGGLRPVVAIYSSFLQRALDCVFHDVCLQGLPVIICEDRSGIVEDGPTHHGIHDVSFLLNMPNLSVLSPRDETELKEMLFAAYEKACPVVIRYPRGSSGRIPSSVSRAPLSWGKAELLKDGSDLAIWAAGREVSTALEVAKILKESAGLDAAVVNARFLKPFDSELLAAQAAKAPLATIEDCQVFGGLGSIIDAALASCAGKGARHFGWGDQIIPHGDVETLRELSGMTPAAIADKLKAWLKPA